MRGPMSTDDVLMRNLRTSCAEEQKAVQLVEDLENRLKTAKAWLTAKRAEVHFGLEALREAAMGGVKIE